MCALSILDVDLAILDLSLLSKIGTSLQSLDSVKVVYYSVLENVRMPAEDLLYRKSVLVFNH